MSYCDDRYTKVPKPTAPSYTTSAKPTASYSVTAKPATPSYTVNAKPAVSYTIAAKATSPSYTVVPEPCLEPLAILTEDGIEILHEDTRVMVVEGAL